MNVIRTYVLLKRTLFAHLKIGNPKSGADSSRAENREGESGMHDRHEHGHAARSAGNASLYPPYGVW